MTDEVIPFPPPPLDVQERMVEALLFASAAPMKNGMRHPQADSSGPVITICKITRTSDARSWPPISVTYWKDAKKPRRPLIATSLM